MRARQATLIRFLNTKDRKFRKGLIESYAIASQQINAEIAKGFAKYGEEYRDWMAYRRLESLEEQINQTIKELNKGNRKSIQARMRESYSDSYYGSIYGMADEFPQLSFALLDDRKIIAALDNPYDRIKWPNRLAGHHAMLTDQLRQEITVGLLNNRGYREIAKSVQNRMGITATQAERIARTETHRVQNQGTLDGYDNASELNGLPLVRTWYSAHDPRTRPDHVAMDNVKADEEGIFTLPDGVKTKAPGLSGAAQHDINCRCRMVMEVDLEAEIETPNKRKPPGAITASSEKRITLDDWLAESIKQSTVRRVLTGNKG